MKMLIFFLLFSINSSASMFGEENIVLGQILTTTITQLNELEKLVSNAEKYTSKIQEYNELIEDQYLKAMRVKYLALELTAKKEIKNLEDVNNQIRDLQNSMNNIKNLLKEYDQIIIDSDKEELRISINKKLIKSKKLIAKKQVRRSVNVKDLKTASRLTAQNTAMILETGLDQEKTLRELLVEQKKSNKLKAQELKSKKENYLAKKKLYSGDEL